MEYKECSICKGLVPLSGYQKREQTRSGYRSECNKCIYMRNLARRRTVDGLIRRIYNKQTELSSKRGHEPPTYSLDGLTSFLRKNDTFLRLYDAWVAGGYQTDDSPSIDRLDNTKGYSFGNIRIVTWGENNKAGHETNRKPIIQYTIGGREVARYPSLTEASKTTGICFSSISSCANDRYSNAGGFIFRYA